MLPEKLVFVDVETTGVNPIRDRVIEVGLVRTEGGEITATLNSLINPGINVPTFISYITGITTEDCTDQPYFHDMSKRICEIMDDAVFVAHNARFDYSFMREELRRCGVNFRSDVLCTVRLSRKLYPDERRHNLDSVIERFSLTNEDRHRAFADATVVAKFYAMVTKTHDPEAISPLIEKRNLNPHLPPKLSHLKFAEIPELYGVYIFRSENNLPLYIGKSYNLRERIMEHFRVPQTKISEQEIYREAADLEIVQASGPLGMGITELRLIRSLKPLLNGHRKDNYISKSLIPAWLTEGPVMVTETSELKQEFHVIDDWCYLGSVKAEVDIPELLSRKRIFDPDIFHFLKQELKYAKLIPLAKNLSVCVPIPFVVPTGVYVPCNVRIFLWVLAFVVMAVVAWKVKHEK